MKKLIVNMRVNGKERSVSVSPGARLLDVIREELELTGTKEGCGMGECGACTVIVNGEAVNSCLIPAASMEGMDITTIEGVALEGGALHPIQEKFITHSALQCGFCTPGMVMSSKALLDQNPNPTQDEVKTALSGNLCRCTGYSQIVEAVEDAAEGYEVFDYCKKK